MRRVAAAERLVMKRTKSLAVSLARGETYRCRRREIGYAPLLIVAAVGATALEVSAAGAERIARTLTLVPSSTPSRFEAPAKAEKSTSAMPPASIDNSARTSFEVFLR